jgi:hypothetical protein
MGVSTHPIDSIIVISLWQGDACTGTFRLSIEDAAPLIATLASGMAEAIPNGDGGFGGTRSEPTQWWLRRLRRILIKTQRPAAGPLRLLK